jgi:tetratricopeptide (TPR) repeat protein
MLRHAWRLFSRGHRLQGRWRISEAAAVFDEALKLLSWEPVDPPRPGTDKARLLARILISRALTLTYSGEASAGLALLDQVDRFVDRRDRGLLLHQRAVILHQIGRPLDALQYFDLAEPILAEYGPDWTYAGLFLNQANALRDLGELTRGLESARRARTLFARLGRRLNQVKAQHVEALLLLDLGEIAKALVEFEEVRVQYREHAPELEAFLHDSNADALLNVGMYRQAIEHWTEAIATQRSAGDFRGVAMSEFWRAVAAYEDNQFEVAAEWAERAMNALYKQGNEAMAFLARLLILQGQFDSGSEGPDFADRVSRLCDALEQRGWTLRLNQARILAVRARIRAGDHEAAETLLSDEQSGQGIETMAEDLARHLAKAELAIAQGLDPMPELQAGLDQLDEYRMAFGSVEFQAGVSALGVQLSSMGLTYTTNNGTPADMLRWAERSRAQALRIPPVKSSADSDREALGRLRQARQRLWHLQVQGEDASDELERVRVFEEEIRAYDRAKPGPGLQADRIDPEDIHELAESRETAVVGLYEVGGDVRAILAGVDGLRHVRLMPLEAAAELERRLGADLDALGKPFRLPPRLQMSVESSLRRNASALAEGIWDPIADYVGDRQVVIVPHSRLAWVPWPLLPQLRGRPVTVSPSAEAWWRAVHRSAATGPALVAAGPALSRAGGEIETIASLYPGAQLIRADESDPEKVLKALDGASVAHIAAHGHHEPDNVLFSRLDFGLGPLNAYELLSLDQPPGHVVLSSCDLGRSTVAVGNETLGFTAALLHAGTSTVVSSLGRVPDDMAAEMMIEYHQHCAKGATPAEALAAVGEHRPWHPFVAFGA